MAGLDDKATQGLRDELAELEPALLRKRSEVSNLKVGYIRAVEGIATIPPEPLRRNLIATRAELTKIEQRIAAIRAQLGEPEQVTPLT